MPCQGAGAGRGEGPTVLGPEVKDADGNLQEVGASRVNEGAASPPANAGCEGAGVGGRWGQGSAGSEGPPWCRDLVGYLRLSPRRTEPCAGRARRPSAEE
jgi:hypothetical protein